MFAHMILGMPGAQTRKLNFAMHPRLLAALVLLPLAGFSQPAWAAVALTPAQVEAMTVRQGRSVPPSTLDSTVTGLVVNTASRYASLAFYQTSYQQSVDFLGRMNWTGVTTNCDEGAVSAEFHDDVLRRIHYFRAMAGLNTDITFATNKNAKSQKAALIMSRNNTLTHTPTNTLPCWTADGSEAAANANLSWGSYDYTGPLTIDGQIRDSGAGNEPVGHRRWLLYSRARVMGNGGVRMQGTNGGASAIWVIGEFNPDPPTPKAVAWPPAGFVPSPLAFPRWSFGLSSADDLSFSGASVSMTVNGTNVPVTIKDWGDMGYGDYTLVWEPQGWTTNAPSTDLVCRVVISNVTGVASSVYQYTVTVFNPQDPGVQSQPSGPTQTTVGAASLFTWSGLEGGTQYLVRISSLVPASRIENAEPSPPPRILDGTSPAYPLITNSPLATGSNVFHLAFPSSTSQWFAIDADFVPSASSELRFTYFRRYSRTNNTFSAEVSRNSGFSWQRVWFTSGVCTGGTCSSDAWDTAWRTSSVSLSAFSGQPVRVRFTYEPNGSIYQGTNSNYGIFSDNIEITDAREIVTSVTQSVSGASSYAFTPASTGEYLIAVGAQLYGYTFPYGPAQGFASSFAPLNVRATGMALNGTNLILNSLVEGGTGGVTQLTVEHAPYATGAWQAAEGVLYDPGQQSLSVPRESTWPAEFFRIRTTP